MTNSDDDFDPRKEDKLTKILTLALCATNDNEALAAINAARKHLHGRGLHGTDVRVAAFKARTWNLDALIREAWMAASPAGRIAWLKEAKVKLNRCFDDNLPLEGPLRRVIARHYVFD
jgi:hypothetical protein